MNYVITVFFFVVSIFATSLSPAANAAARGGAGDRRSALHRAARMLLSPFSAEKAPDADEDRFTSIALRTESASPAGPRPTVASPSPAPARDIVRAHTPARLTSPEISIISASSPTNLALPQCAPAKNVTVNVYHERKSVTGPILELATVASFKTIKLSYREFLNEFAERLLALTLQQSGFKGSMSYKNLTIEIEGYVLGGEKLWQEVLFTPPTPTACSLKDPEVLSALLRTHQKITPGEISLPPPATPKTIVLILAQP